MKRTKVMKVRKGYYSKLYKIPIYITDMDEMAIEGRNWFWDLILDIAIWWDMEIVEIEIFDIIVEKE